MNWQLWLVTAYFAFQAGAVILRIGKPREVLTPGWALAGVIELGAVVGLLVWGATA